jgi:hypothetical protein
MRAKGRGAVALCVLAAIGAGAAAGPAAASDKGLLKVVKREEARAFKLAVAFKQADDGLATATTTDAAKNGATQLRNGLHHFKVAIVPIKTQSANGRRGKDLLLKAIREFDLGLVQYLALMAKLDQGTTREEIRADLVTVNKRIAAAAANESKALKLIARL